MKIINLFLCVVLMHSSLLLAMEMASVAPLDGENPLVMQCLLCKKKCVAIVGLNRVYNGNLSIFTLCKDCLAREIKKRPHLFELFTCPCQGKLKESCLVHVVETPASVLLESELPLIDVNQLTGGFKPWLIQQGREAAATHSELSDHLRSMSHCCYVPRWPLVSVSITLLVTACILLFVYCPSCQNACCGDSCDDDKKQTCFYSCNSCAWGLGTLSGGGGLNIINLVMYLFEDASFNLAKENSNTSRALIYECDAAWPDEV